MSTGSLGQHLGSTLTPTDGRSIEAHFEALPPQIGAWARDPSREDRAREAGLISLCYQNTAAPLSTIRFLIENNTAKVVGVTVPAADLVTAEASGIESDLISHLRVIFKEAVLIEGSEAPHLKDRISEALYHKFRHHSHAKDAGNSHPPDRKRWLDFVIGAAHEGLDHSEENVSLVQSALKEEGFSDWHAHKIAQDFLVQVEAMKHALNL